MKTSTFRKLLCSGASIVLPASVAMMSTQAQAATDCTVTSGNVNCVDNGVVVATGTTNGVQSYTNQLVLLSAGDLTLDLAGSGPIVGNEYGILASANGGNSILNVNAAGIDFSQAASTGAAARFFGKKITATVGNLTATGDFSDALYFSAGSDGATVTAGNVSASGSAGHGIDGYSGGNLTLTAGNVSSADGQGVQLSTYSLANIDATIGNIAGATVGLQLYSQDGDITAHVGDVATSGAFDSAEGIYAVTDAGKIEIDAGDVNTASLNSTGVYVVNNGSQPTTLRTGSVHTTGDTSDAVNIVAGIGKVTYTATGDVITEGATSRGMRIVGNDIDATFGTVSALGADSKAVSLSGENVAVHQSADSLAQTFADNSMAVDLTAYGSLTGTLGNIETKGLGSDALHITSEGTVDLTTGYIHTSQAGSGGVYINANNASGPTTLTTGAVGTLGADSTAVDIESAGSVTYVANGVIGTAGANSKGIYIASDDTVDATFGDVETSGSNANAVELAGVNVAVHQAPGTKVTTHGVGSNGVSLTSYASLTGTLADISTEGSGAVGLNAVTSGLTDLIVGNLTTAGMDSRGVNFDSGAAGELTKLTVGSVTTSGSNSAGVVMNAGGGLNFTANGAITTSGDGSDGLVLSAANLEATFGNVTTTGSDSTAIYLQADSSLTVHQAAEATTEMSADDLTAVSLVGGDGVFGTLGNITATGLNSYGLYAQSGNAIDLTVGNVQSDAGGVTIDGGVGDVTLKTGTVTSNADDAYGTVILNDGAVTFTGGDHTTHGYGSAGLWIIGGEGPVTATLASATTTGDQSYGILIHRDGPVNLTFGDVSTSGADSDGVYIQADGLITLTQIPGTKVTTTGSGSYGLVLRGAGVAGTIGDVESKGEGSYGVLALVDGDVDLTVGNVTAARNGIDVESELGQVTLTSGSVATTEENSNATTIVAAGPVEYSGGAHTTAGENSDALVIDSGAGITATILSASTSGENANAVTLNTNGAIDFLAGDISTAGASSYGLNVYNISDDLTLIKAGKVTTAGDNSDGFFVSAAGPVNLTAGDITTSGDNARGIDIETSSPDANLTVTTGSIKTAGTLSHAVSLQGEGDITFAANGSVTTSGDSAVGLYFTGDTIDASFGDVSTAGIDAQAIQIAGNDIRLHQRTGTTVSSAGDQTDAIDLIAYGKVSGALANVTATGAGSTALYVDSVESVDLTVGNVSSADGSGVVVEGGAGTINLKTGTVTTGGENSFGTLLHAAGAISFDGGLHKTSGDGADALRILGGEGPVTATLAGATTSGEGAAGARITADGPVTFTNTGTIATSGAQAQGIAVTSTAGPVTVKTGKVSQTGTGTAAAVAATSEGDSVTVQATGNVSSAGGVGIVADAAKVATVIVDSGATVEGLASGADLAGVQGNVLTVNGTLRSTKAGNPAYRVTGGALTLNLGATGNIVGPLAFTAGNDVFNNAGKFVATGTTDFGGGSDTVNNSGIITAVGGATTFANLETFNNAGGLIDLRDAATDDTFTISGNYAATGDARVGLDVSVVNGALTADKLVIGGTVSGTTTILLNPLSGQPLIDTTGVKIVQAAGGSGTFTGSARYGLVNYNVVTRGSEAFVTSAASGEIVDVAQSMSVASDLWHQSAETFGNSLEHGDVGARKFGFFGQLYAAKDKSGGRSVQNLFGSDVDVDSRIDTHRKGAQIGFEVAPAGSPVSFGLTGGYERARADFVSNSGTRMVAKGSNIGAFVRFGGKQGLYGSLLAKHDSFDLAVRNGSLFDASPNGHSNGFAGRLGYRFGGQVELDVSSGVSHVASRIDGFNAGGIDFDAGHMTSTRGDLAGRATLNTKLAPYVDLRVVHDFADANAIDLGNGALSDSIAAPRRGTFGRAEVGIGGKGTGPTVSAWGEFGDLKGAGIRAGFRF